MTLVIDLYQRKLIGWAMDKCMQIYLVCNTFKMAL